MWCSYQPHFASAPAEASNAYRSISLVAIGTGKLASVTIAVWFWHDMCAFFDQFALYPQHLESRFAGDPIVWTRYEDDGHYRQESARLSMEHVKRLPDGVVTSFAAGALPHGRDGRMQAGCKAKRLSREDRHGGAAGQGLVALVRNTKRTRELEAGTMAVTVPSAPIVPLVGADKFEHEDAVPSHVFPFLSLPRELRDQVCISATLLHPRLTAT